MEWMVMPYKRYADFSGRSRRMEYWMFTLFSLIVMVVLIGLMFVGGDLAAMSDPNTAGTVEPGVMLYVGGGLFVLWLLGSLIPSIAVTVRRFHDRDMSGWWVLGFALLGLIPLVGTIASIAQLVIMALPGTSGPNRFGEDPLNTTSADVFS